MNNETPMKSILITGGAGFLGHGLARELLGRGAERICIFSRDEYKHALMDDEFGRDPRLRFFLGDVRDAGRLRRAMAGVHTVIHAAALKRIETAHYNPSELVKTNVIGTMNVIEAAQDEGVAQVIGVSTDKAVAPTSAYGQSKALAESLLLNANNSRGSRGPIYAIAKYGNVFNSTGSIVPTWRKLLAAGAARVPVTDPKCTRYFMTLQEAVNLVLDLGDHMHGGEVAIPQLPAYRVGDLARAMRVEMDVRGLGSFEKLHETMDGVTDSSQARRMSVEELEEALSYA